MLLLNNDDVKSLLSVSACVDVLERAYTDWAFGCAAQMPEGGRMDLGCPSPGGEIDRRFTWGAMAGVLPNEGVFALRQKFDIHYTVDHGGGYRTAEKFCIEPGTFCGFLFVASTKNAEPLAIINDGILQHMRVAGTSAVAARHLAKSDARTLAIIGSGGMARTHAAALSVVRPIEQIRVFSPTKAHRERFAAETISSLDIETKAVDSPADATRNADIIAFCTTAFEPIFPNLDWVEPGVHCTNIRGHQEVGNLAERADCVILHEHGGVVGSWANDHPAAKVDAPPSVTPVGIERLRSDLPTLGDLLAGRVEGRQSDSDVTYFHNRPGAGIQFAAVGAELVRRAREAGRGVEIPTSWFLQDVRD